MDHGSRGRRRAVTLLATLLAALLTALLTGCGDEGTQSSSPPQTSSSTPPAPSTGSEDETDGGRTSGDGTSAAPSPTADETPSPAPGTTIAGEALSPEQAAELQREVDEGHQPWRTDVAAVADAFVRAQLGWDEADVALTDPHTAEVTHAADGRIVTLQLRQPVREAPGGIWVVVSGVWLV